MLRKAGAYIIGIVVKAKESESADGFLTITSVSAALVIVIVKIAVGSALKVTYLAALICVGTGCRDHTRISG